MRVMNALTEKSHTGVHLGCITFSFVDLKAKFKTATAYRQFKSACEQKFCLDLEDIEPGKEADAIKSEDDFAFYATLWLKLLDCAAGTIAVCTPDPSDEAQSARIRQDLFDMAAKAWAKQQVPIAAS
jgi:hypothetical protein